MINKIKSNNIYLYMLFGLSVSIGCANLPEHQKVINKFNPSDFSSDLRIGYFEINGKHVTFAENLCNHENKSIEIVQFSIDDKNGIMDKPYKTQTHESDFNTGKFFDNGFKMDTVVNLKTNEVEALSARWHKYLQLSRKYHSNIKPFSECGENILFEFSDSLVLVNMRKYTRRIFQEGYFERNLGNNWYLYSKIDSPTYKNIPPSKYPYINLTKFKGSKGVCSLDTILISELREIPNNLKDSDKINFLITPELVINLVEGCNKVTNIWYFCYESEDCYFLFKDYRIKASRKAQNILFPLENRLNAQEYDLIIDSLTSKSVVSKKSIRTH
jgi:hypothetical protein